jgi:hypothetical protein
MKNNFYSRQTCLKKIKEKTIKIAMNKKQCDQRVLIILSLPKTIRTEFIKPITNDSD